MGVVAHVQARYCVLWGMFEVKTLLTSLPCPVSLPIPEAKREQESVVKRWQQKIVLKHLCPFDTSVSAVQRSLLPSTVSSFGASALHACQLFLPAIFSDHHVRPKQIVP